MRNSAATQMNQVKRFSHFLDLAEFAEFISEKDNRRLRRVRRCIFCSRRPVGDATPVLFSRQRGASHSEAATAEESVMPQVQAGCVETAARLGMENDRRFACGRLVRHAHSAT